MNTPLYKAVKNYIDKDMARLHMPGHKGVLPDFLQQVAPFDITEVTGADSLFQCEEAILDCENLYTSIYNTKKSAISTGGSTLGIQAMFAMISHRGNKVICGRNIHIAAINAMALLGLTPIFVNPDNSAGEALAGRITPDIVKSALDSHSDVAGVYITSPDYFGVISDISSLSALCKEYNLPLLVDNAHGSHLKFLDNDLHPISLGASLCCDSLHKTMNVMTGGAMVHIGQEEFASRIKWAMGIFGSTSPSYPIMLSIDMNIEYIEKNIKEDLTYITNWVEKMKSLAIAKSIALPQGVVDPTRLALGFYSIGYSKEEFLSLLADYKIEHEYISDHYCVLLPSSKNGEHLTRVEKLLTEISPIGEKLSFPQIIPVGTMAMGLREALLSPRQLVTVEEALNQVSAQVVSRCPPGIPIAVYGELIDSTVITNLKTYGVQEIFVVK